MSSLKERYDAVCSSATQAAQDAGRSPSEICIVAVSKTVGVDVVKEALAAGVVDFGENRTDSLLPKQAAYPQARWHFIGNIQSRKIKDIVGKAYLIHSVDRRDLFEKLEAAAEAAGIVQDILLEVNVSGEESKSGFRPSEVEEALREVSACRHLKVCGFMTMAPQAEQPIIRATFKGLRVLRDQMVGKVSASNISLDELSMGMSGDYAIAIEEGATIIRVGRSIFSEEFANTETKS